MSSSFSLQIYTVGHSTRTLDEFLAILEEHKIGILADIRTVPRSRTNPQFNKDTLSVFLEGRGIAYVHLKSLGGLRHPRNDSQNLAWTNTSFRGYADHMQTEEFENGINDLLRLARKDRVAIMCAEALPWRCHRRLVADSLAARGMEVFDILSVKGKQIHELTKWAKVDGTRITYPKQI
ncbi:MAG: DUF488 domain-containing protein [Thaumarchaeota archaeon]|nr:DUF488 domain-containing protein [Nitrososphaerota archaeon]